MKSDIDIYLFEPLESCIIVNSNDDGLAQISSNLELSNLTHFDRSLYFYTLFHSLGDSQLLLYCPQEVVLAYHNRITGLNRYIPLDTISEVLSPIYKWNKNEVIVASYSGKWFRCNVETLNIDEIKDTYIQENYSLLYNFFKKIQSHDQVYCVDSISKSFVSKKDSHAEWFDSINDKSISSEYCPDDSFHDIYYHHGYFVFIGEKK